MEVFVCHMCSWLTAAKGLYTKEIRCIRDTWHEPSPDDDDDVSDWRFDDVTIMATIVHTGCILHRIAYGIELHIASNCILHRVILRWSRVSD